MIFLNNITENSDRMDKLKHEVHAWAITAAQLSGLCQDEGKARQFAKEKILEVFENFPSKQHGFEINMDDMGVVGRAWMIEKDNIAQPEFRLAYLKIDEAYQSRGLAGKAVALLEAYGVQKGYHKFTINVFGHLPHSFRLSKSLNFKVTHEIKKGDRLIATELTKIISDLTN